MPQTNTPPQHFSELGLPSFLQDSLRALQY